MVRASHSAHLTEVWYSDGSNTPSIQILWKPGMTCKGLFINYATNPCQCSGMASQLLKTILRHLNKSFNCHLSHLLEVVQDWYRSIFWTEVTEPYPQSKGSMKSAISTLETVRWRPLSLAYKVYRDVKVRDVIRYVMTSTDDVKSS